MKLPLRALLLLLIASPASAQQPWVDPALRLIQDRDLTAFEAVPPQLVDPADPDRASRRGLMPPRLPVVIERGPGGVARVPLLVEVRTAAGLDDMRALGAEIGTVIGRIATVRAPVASLDALVRLTSLRRVQAARPVHPTNDSAVSMSRVDEVRQRRADAFMGATGEGVIIGVLDTGLDYDHPDFLDPDSVPRTIAIWDQVRGSTCDSTQIRERACFSTDVQGHGTHVTGIAAGDGSAAGDDPDSRFRYAGVAPGAGIAAVKFSFQTFADLIDGVAWVFDVADAAGRPAVVNLSLGSHSGPHDGTDLAEQALDSLSGPGRIVVVAAGNEGNAQNTAPPLIELLIHGTGTPAPGQDVAMTFEITDYSPIAGLCNDFAFLEAWYDGTQAIDITVRRPNGTTATGSTGDTISADGATGQIDIIAPPDPNPENGDRTALIVVSDCSGTPEPGNWTVTFSSAETPSEPLHLWITQSAFGANGLALGRAGFDNSYVISSPGNANEAITVGAYVSRVAWPTPAGQASMSSLFGFSQTVGDIAFFSSAGPTRDGRLKPEITAPGLMIMSTRPSSFSVPTQLLAPSGRHRIEFGTSMASPHVAGIVALLLEQDPTLTPAEVRSILTSTAATDGFTAIDHSDNSNGTPNEQWGHGKADARAALETLVDPSVATELWLSVESDTLPLGATLTVVGVIINAFGDSLAAPTWSSSDPSVATVAADGTVTPVGLGTATITATGGGFTETVFVEVVPPATLIVDASPLPAPPAGPSSAGRRIALLDLELAVDGFEGVLVDTLGFTLYGRDPGARFLLIEDVDNDGTISFGEPVLADTAVALTGDSVQLLVTPALIVPAGDTLNLIAALRLSGAAPNGATFQIIFRPELTSSEGLRSGAEQRTDPASSVASATATTTVLATGEVFTLSENPVRSDARRLILNFGAPPDLAAIYTLRGVQVRNLMPLLESTGARIEWDLTTSDGGITAPGVYFLIVRVDGELIRTKLIIARGYGGGDG